MKKIIIFTVKWYFRLVPLAWFFKIGWLIYSFHYQRFWFWMTIIGMILHIPVTLAFWKNGKKKNERP